MSHLKFVRLWTGYMIGRDGSVYNGWGKRIRPTRNSTGYHSFTCGGKSIKLSRAVALAWLPNPKGLKYVNHINGNKTDDRVENLEWCSSSDNQKHAYATGLKIPSYANRALTEEQVREVRSLFGSTKMREIAKKYYVHLSVIESIKYGRAYVGVAS
jgi:HNH endonuclease